MQKFDICKYEIYLKILGNDEFPTRCFALICCWLAFYAAIFTLGGYPYLRSTLNYAWFGAPR